MTVTMIRVFISYRRSDAEHAAQRVRGAMRARFGEEAVFIDRDIPAGVDWAAHLNEQIAGATEVIVLVGDSFVTELRRRAAPAEATAEKDWLRAEIATALVLHKKIYPVIIGRREMPDRSRLPAEIQAFANTQALFAREPAFDAAIAKLADTIAASRGWLIGSAATASGKDQAPASWQGLTALLLGLAVLVGVGLLGSQLQWLAAGAPPQRVEAALWLGTHFLLLTLLWGLGPYVVYRAVAEVRMRAMLPVHNALGGLTMINISVALLAGGTFLLLSTRADFVLRLRGVMPPEPGALAYGLQGVALVCIVFAALGTALAEPMVRRRADERARQAGMRWLVAASFAVLAANLWFAGSVALSVDLGERRPLVPVIGYFLLAPALPAMIWGLQLAVSWVGLDTRAWYNRALFGLALSLYLMATMGYYAHGPARFMGGLL